MADNVRLSLSNEEFFSRRKRLFARLAERPAGGLDAVVLFLPHNVSYFAKFGFMVTERPIALVLAPDRATLLVPRLEKEHAEAVALVDEVAVYPEYPDVRHPMEFLRDVLLGMGLGAAAIGCDAPGASQVFGYRGPSLAQLLPGARVETVLDDIEALQMIKSQEELELIELSARWGHRAHELLQQYARPGVGEVELSQQASAEATREMLKALGPGYVPQSWEKAGAYAGFHGQVGKQSALPHVLTSNAKLMPGDVLVTLATSTVAGYFSELERTMIMGEPSKEQERFFRLMLEARALAIEMMGPGVRCAQVDAAVREFFEANGLMPYWRHHTGHGLGRLLHEPPYLDIGDERVLMPGMVVSVEPGIYVPGLGGFRHSDTVVITEDGVRFITTYPRQLEDLVIPC
ncbi:MAG: Xaa-Pro peptidase family protein [Bacillota bacterium]